MKIKPLTIIVLVALIIAGFFYYSDNTKTSETTVATQDLKPSPTPEATPNRTLKPNEEFVGLVGLYITVPEGMTFRQEPDARSERPDIVGFYIEKETDGEIAYQLYGIYPASNSASEEGLAKARKEMDSSTIKEVTIGGMKGIEGMVTGAKNRYFTALIKDDKLLTFSTYPPTPENKEVTDQILSTVSFQ